jgi:predicted transcriptional regulator
MFFIVNKTKGTVVLGDLKLTLGPRQAIDLDKIMNRSKSEASKSLKTAKKNGDIEVRIKDKPSKIPDTQVLPAQNDMGNIKEEIIGEMKDVMQELLKGQTGGVSKEDLQELINAMPKSQETVIIRQEGEKIKEDEEVEVEAGEIGEMNKRAVNKMVENVDSVDIKYKEEKQKNDLDNQISELEGLLGD